MSGADDLVKAEIRSFRGAPCVFVNDRPFHIGAVLYKHDHLGSLPASEDIGESRTALPSFRKIMPDTFMAYSAFDVSPDLSGCEAGLDSLLEWLDELFLQNPNALAACHIGLAPSVKWADANPGEMVAYDRPVPLSKEKHGHTGRQPSWASQKWQEDSAQLVSEIVSRCRKEFSSRVILYQVGGGMCWENVTCPVPDSGTNITYCMDFSAPMLRYFRGRLRLYYENDLHRMRRAWSDDTVDFDTAVPPSRIERIRSEWFAFRSPFRSRTADFYRALSEAVEDCVICWAKAVKKASGNRALTASPLGAVLDTGLNFSLNNHLSKNTFGKALKSPWLDMLESPASYALRDPGRGGTCSMIPLGSLRLRNKIWLRDFDSRTSLVDGEPGRDVVEDLWRNPKSPWEDVETLKRDAGYSLMHSGCFWWHEIKPGMYRLPEHMKIASRIKDVAKGLLRSDRVPAAGMGIFIDPPSNFLQAASNRLIYAMNYEARRLHWSHCGMAHEIYCMEDVDSLAGSPHTVFMVTNAFCITEKQARAVADLARKNGGVVIWLVAPGVQGDSGFDLGRMSRITGFRIKSADVEALPTVSMVPGRNAWIRPSLANGKNLENFGGGEAEYDDCCSRSTGPLFYADVGGRRDVEVLGVLEALAEPGLVVKNMDGYKSVYCAAPYVHNSLLRAIGKDCGTHVYLDTDDTLYATGELLLVNAKSAGKKDFILPRKVQTVFELYSGHDVAKECSRFSVSMDEFQTCFFFAGSDSVASEIKQAMRERLCL